MSQHRGDIVRRAFFLDRDGVINKSMLKEYVKHPREFEFLPGVFDAIKLINQSGWLAVIITNQSMIGRGMATEEALLDIHKHMLLEIESHGGRVDGLYYCPHAPEENCSCRKPEPGMLLQAAKELDIDISESVMIGDMASDIEVGKNAGTKMQALVTPGKTLLDIVKAILETEE